MEQERRITAYGHEPLLRWQVYFHVHQSLSSCFSHQRTCCLYPGWEVTVCSGLSKLMYAGVVTGRFADISVRRQPVRWQLTCHWQLARRMHLSTLLRSCQRIVLPAECLISEVVCRQNTQEARVRHGFHVYSWLETALKRVSLALDMKTLKSSCIISIVHISAPCSKWSIKHCSMRKSPN